MLQIQRYSLYNWKGKQAMWFNDKAFCYVAVKSQQLKVEEVYNRGGGPQATKVMLWGVASFHISRVILGHDQK